MKTQGEIEAAISQGISDSNWSIWVADRRRFMEHLIYESLIDVFFGLKNGLVPQQNVQERQLRNVLADHEQEYGWPTASKLLSKQPYQTLC